MSQAKSTFWVYEDYRGIHHIVDSLEKVPPSLKDKALVVEVTPEEAEALRQAQPENDQVQEYSTGTLDNGSEYADKLPPGVTADTMAGAGIFLLALVFLRRLALYYGYKTFARIASIAIFTMALGVVWTAARVVVEDNAAKQQEQTQEYEQEARDSD
tara:strand:+ start:255 stop:725 length:471 start_codon:yes stop_codon:yes gene_type:complete